MRFQMADKIASSHPMPPSFVEDRAYYDRNIGIVRLNMQIS